MHPETSTHCLENTNLNSHFTYFSNTAEIINWKKFTYLHVFYFLPGNGLLQFWKLHWVKVLVFCVNLVLVVMALLGLLSWLSSLFSSPSVNTDGVISGTETDANRLPVGKLPVQGEGGKNIRIWVWLTPGVGHRNLDSQSLHGMK